MFCNHCGAQLPDGSKFCNSCGAQLPAETAQPQPQAQPQEQVQPQAVQTAPKQEKKKPSLLISVIIGLAAFVFGSLVIAPALSGGGTQNGGSGTSAGTSTSATPSAAYQEIFNSRNIVVAPAFFGTPDSTAFARVDNEMVENMEFGYKGGIVQAFSVTMYIPTSNLTESERQELDTIMREQFQSAEALSFCTAKYTQGNLYYTASLTFNDLDQTANVNQLSGMSEFLTDGLLAMSKVEQSLVGAGWTKR